ncbi:hypothetical protein CEXT_555041 [Caerostris extrusa]|uniref:Uncharacterized protein n=1 Tax=Caerostris extrusa TaxID=172846 RepID=A0AAV4XRA7_CAEEX|nr:hypothetical protein CEXT_555041 [Caerostris extrusa]
MLVLLPSLKHICKAQVIIALSKPYFRVILEMYGASGHLPLTHGIAEEVLVSLTSRVQEKILVLQHQILQQTELSEYIHPILFEVGKWVSEHTEIWLYDIDPVSCFHWKSEGIIDRQRTAEALVRDTNLDIVFRCHLACSYCMKDDIVLLWNQMSEGQKQAIRDACIYKPVKFWISWIEAGTELDPMSRNFINLLKFSYTFNPEGMHNLLKMMNRKLGQALLVKLARKHMLQPCIVGVLLSYLDNNQQIVVFKKSIGTTLCCFLDWPWQSLFMDVFLVVRPYMHKEQFLNVLDYLINIKIYGHFNDYNYLAILKELWGAVGSNLQECALRRYNFAWSIDRLVNLR